MSMEQTDERPGTRADAPGRMARIYDFYDCTGHIGPSHPTQEQAEWPMYSFERPSFILWNAIAGELHRRGWRDKQIRDWLQSKNTRWALDMDLGEALQKLGREYAETVKPWKG